jgi:hypothetical protein
MRDDLDGIAEDIIPLLSKSRALLVIARNSSFTYKGRVADIKQNLARLDVIPVLPPCERTSTDTDLRKTSRQRMLSRRPKRRLSSPTVQHSPHTQPAQIRCRTALLPQSRAAVSALRRRPPSLLRCAQLAVSRQGAVGRPGRAPQAQNHTRCHPLRRHLPLGLLPSRRSVRPRILVW